MIPKLNSLFPLGNFFTYFQKWRFFSVIQQHFCDFVVKWYMAFIEYFIHWGWRFLPNFVGRLDFCKINKGGKWKNSTILGVWAFLLCSTYCVMLSNKSTQCSFFCESEVTTFFILFGFLGHFYNITYIIISCRKQIIQWSTCRRTKWNLEVLQVSTHIWKYLLNLTNFLVFFLILR